MTKQQEDYKKLASEVRGQAERETGPYRDVLLGVAEAYAALALHQGVFDDWARTYPVRQRPRGEPPAQPAGPGEAKSTVNPAVGRQANENGRPVRPSAAA
ncbi:MAG: hypothetical protein JO000_01170 [Alphaproteobacteria bacterium]|nr:hypothetical protein [Alphaproteobacteria bacterium]